MRLHRRSVARVLFWLACLAAFAMAVMPYPPELPAAPPDKLVHAAVFVLLALLGRWAYPDWRKRALLLGLAAFGASIEIVQALPVVGRDGDPADWLADVAAAAAVLIVIALWPRPRGAKRRG